MSARKRIVVTGLGLVSPHGGVDALSAGRLGQGSALSVPLANGTRLRSFEDFDSSRFVPPRLKRKIDPFVVYGLSAAGQCLEDSAVAAGRIDKASVGVFVGNCLGGWGYIEPQVRGLHVGGVKEMSPYVATAWFPAALQGQISLEHGIKGLSKTFSARNVAGLQAIGNGIAALQSGRVKAALCGAAEGLNTPYVRAVLGHPSSPTSARGAVLGEEVRTDLAEGAAFLMLEEREHALARGAWVYCEVSGAADGFCPAESLIPRVMYDALKQAAGDAGNPALLVRDGMLAKESEWVRHVVGDMAPTVTVVNSKPAYGHMFALSGVFEAVLAARHLQSGTLSASLYESGDRPDAGCSAAIIQRMSPRGGIGTLGLVQC